MLRVVLVAGWLAVFASVTHGQAFFPIEGGATAGRFIEPPRTTLQQLRLAQEATNQKRYGDAVVILGDLLQREQTVDDDELVGQDFFLDSSGEVLTVPRVSKTLIGEARRMLTELPSEAIATYELRYGAQARKILTDAAAERRWSDVAEVKRRFFHTEAGRDATQLLIQRAVLRGNRIEASRSTAMFCNIPSSTASCESS
jgi:hypothetical protein